jgi:hypothetical protein
MMRRRSGAVTVAFDDGGGVAVVTGDGRGLLQNRGGEGNVRHHLNRKEEGSRPKGGVFWLVWSGARGLCAEENRGGWHHG